MIPEFKVEKLKKNRKKAKELLRITLTLSVWFFVVGSIVFMSYFIYLQRTLPDPETIVARKVGESTKIYDSTGESLLYDIHGEEKRTIISWEEIPEYIKKATLASEDTDFYNHKGLDLKGIARAMVRNIQSIDISEGGSTITQQLVGNALVGRQQTLGRKIREAILSIEIERRFSKDEIFWMYLNQIPYGSNAYGVEAAAKTFFGKPAKDLTLAESALLTSLIKAPTYYSPYGSHVEELMGVKNNILKRMKDLAFITEEEYKKASEQKLEFKNFVENINAPHFVIMVREYLVSKYGEEAVQRNGLKVITTLNSEFQKIAEEAVSKYSKINKEKYKASNSALVALNPKNGEVLALVGSSDYFDKANEGNFNVITAQRQPGSSFKPFAYAALFNKGYPDSTILFDVKTEFNPNCPPHGNALKDEYGLDCYNPGNYDGQFRGPVTLRSSLAQSLNIPSVKTLYLAGIDNTINLAESMGITTLKDRKRYGLSLVLGGAEVKPIDITSAYGVFANDGIRNPWFIIKKIEDSQGNVLEEHQAEPKRVLEAQTARLISDVLSDNNARSPVFGYSSSLHIPGRDVAAKTGTTQENRDAWVIGYAPNLAAGVWTGNNKNTSMTREGAGISASGPLWNEFMVKALSKLPNENFAQPDPVFSNKIMLNGQYYYQPDIFSAQEIHNILYYVNPADPLGPFPASLDPQFNNWEWAVKSFYNFPI